MSDEESKAFSILRKHRRLIINGIEDISPLLDCLVPGVENLPAETIEVIYVHTLTILMQRFIAFSITLIHLNYFDFYIYH